MDQPATPAPRSPEPGDAAAVPEDDLPPDLPIDLPPELDATVRGLLASVPDPGPMPASVSTRVTAALARETRLRIEPGPLGHSAGDGQRDGQSDGAPVALAPRRQRPRPAFALAAVAAAAALVVVGGSALHLTKRPLATASLGNPGTSSAPGQVGAADPDLHIQLSRTDYSAATVPTLARDLVTQPDAPLQVLAAEAPLLGPIATPIGLRSCLEELGVPRSATVHADLATYAGEPAAVIVTTLAGADTAWVVGRQCSTGQPALVAGPMPVP